MSSINTADLDDVAILDVTSNTDDDKEPLLANAIDNTQSIPHVDTVFVPSISRYRLTNILRTMVLLEFLSLFIIWLVGKEHLRCGCLFVAQRPIRFR